MAAQRTRLRKGCDRNVAAFRDGAVYSLAVVILLFFVLHWQVSVFFQSFYLHRYGAHRQFTMSKRWERTMHFLTWRCRGRATSVRAPTRSCTGCTTRTAIRRGTLILPFSKRTFFAMMWRTKKIYEGIKNRRLPVEPRFEGGYPEWELLDGNALELVDDDWVGGALRALLHRLRDALVDVPPFTVSLVHRSRARGHRELVRPQGRLSELRRRRQLEEHARLRRAHDGRALPEQSPQVGQSPDFAVRWFEIDPAYQIMKGLAALRIIDMSGAQKARWQPGLAAPVPPILPAPSPMDGE